MPPPNFKGGGLTTSYLIGLNFGGLNSRKSILLPKIVSAEIFCLPKIMSAEIFQAEIQNIPCTIKAYHNNVKLMLKHKMDKTFSAEKLPKIRVGAENFVRRKFCQIRYAALTRMGENTHTHTEILAHIWPRQIESVIHYTK